MVDFNIQRDKDRVEEVKRELKNKTSPSKAQLDMLADYILFGKDQNGYSPVDKGEIEIETKYKSYKKKQVESLEGLMENPAFNENEFQPVKKSVYKNPKPELDKSLPELQSLLEAIEYYEELKNKLEQEPETSELKTRIWKLSHTIIDLKKQQYVIQEAIRGTMKCMNLLPQTEVNPEFLNGEIGPLGLKIGTLDRFINPKDDKSLFQIPSNPTINFENPSHIYAILELYGILYEKSINNPYNNGKYLLETLNWYIDQTPLDESRKIIIQMKKMKFQNSEIKKVLNDKFQLTYNENYISTIYTKEICKKISERVTLHKDEWAARNEPSKWKKCTCCGQWKLKDSRNFVKKKNSSDGFTSRCKICDKMKRKENK